MSQFNAFAVTLDFQSNDKLLDFSFEQNFFENKIKNFRESELFCSLSNVCFLISLTPELNLLYQRLLLPRHIVLLNDPCNWWKLGLKQGFLIPDAPALTLMQHYVEMFLMFINICGGT